MASLDSASVPTVIGRPQPLTPATDSRAIRPLALPRRVDRYRIEGQLGRGGMGTVALAVDETLQREVALKLVHVPSIRPREQARILREAKSMAQLDHENVVQVFDVGLWGDHIYIAMERIDGPDLATWLRTAGRPTAEIVRAFAQIARALAAVHARGLLHRDFKPHNAVVGADGRVRLIDFGLARDVGATSIDPESLDADSSDLASLSQSGTRTDGGRLTEAGAVMGTPAYMSPEQVTGEEIGPASDQFSFCVALFEALYGDRPFQGKPCSTLVANIAAGRIETPAGVAIPRSLDRIVRRGLRVEAAQRWPSMDDLAAALERSGRSRFALVVGLVGAGVGLAVLSGPDHDACQQGAKLGDAWAPSTAASIESTFAASEVSYAGETWERLGPRLQAFADAWTDARREVCETSLEDEQLDAELSCLDRQREHFGRITTALAAADDTVVEKATELARGLGDPQDCLDPTTDAGLEVPPALRDEVRTLRSELAKARSLRPLGRTEEAAGICTAVAGRARELDVPWIEAQAMIGIGSAVQAAGDLEAALEQFSGAYDLARAHGFGRLAATAAMQSAYVAVDRAKWDDADQWLGHAAAALTRLGNPEDAMAEYLDHRARLHHYQGQYDEAAESFEAALEVISRVEGERSASAARTLDHLGSTYGARGQYDASLDAHARALAIFEEVNGPHHPSAGRAWTNLGNALSRKDRRAEAIDAFTRSYEILSAAYDDDHTTIASVLMGRGSAYLAIGDEVAARADMTRALALHEASRPPGDPRIGIVLNNLGNLEMEAGDVDAAERYYHRAHELYTVAVGATHPSAAVAMLNLGRIAQERGDHPLAIERLQGGLAGIRAGYGDEHPYVGMGLVNLASSQRQQGDLDAAEASYREALAIMGAALDKTDPRLGVVSVGLARVAHARGDPGQAIATLDTVLSGWETADHPPEDHELAAARLALAQALADTRREPGRAAALAEQARAYYAGRNRDPRVREADAVLRAVRWPARSRRSRPPDAVSPTGPV